MRRPPRLRDFIQYPVVSGTIALAVGITVASWSGVDVSALYETIDIRRGQLWRLLTSTLPHGDILHLLFNVYWTWVFGTLIEKSFGHASTFAIFILLAAAANGAEYAFLSGGIGLSGIGYGLFGLVWLLSRRDQRFSDAIDPNTIRLFIGWFFFCIFLTVSGYPIANIAHGVGAVTGVLLGRTISGSTPQRLGASAAVAILVAAIILGATIARPWVNLSKERGYDEALLGYNALLADQNDQALRWYRDAVRMQPLIAGNWFNLGIANDRLSHHSEAIAAYKKAHDLDPSNAKFEALSHDSN